MPLAPTAEPVRPGRQEGSAAETLPVPHVVHLLVQEDPDVTHARCGGGSARPSPCPFAAVFGARSSAWMPSCLSTCAGVGRLGRTCLRPTDARAPGGVIRFASPFLLFLVLRSTKMSWAYARSWRVVVVWNARPSTFVLRRLVALALDPRRREFCTAVSCGAWVSGGCVCVVVCERVACVWVRVWEAGGGGGDCL